MTKKVKFTFKLTPKITGLAAVGNSARGADIKLDTKKVGMIQAPNWRNTDHKYSVSFAVKEVNPNNPNVDWVWKTLNKRTSTLQEMKEWLNTVSSEIVERYELHSFS